MAGDTRPHGATADDSVSRIAEVAIARLDILLAEAADQVKALPGHAGERENDALSLVATVASRAALNLVCRLVDAKGVTTRDVYATQHETWCTVVMNVRYGTAAVDRAQVDIEDAIAASASSGDAPECAPLPDPDAPAPGRADVSAPKAARRDKRSRPQPETARA